MNNYFMNIKEFFFKKFIANLRYSKFLTVGIIIENSIKKLKFILFILFYKFFPNWFYIYQLEKIFLKYNLQLQLH